METILAHHGIKGQKWGIRRFQNRDGTWTSAGKERYGDDTLDRSKTQKSTKKKVATGVAVGAAAVAGVVLTAYLVKKMGNKNLSELTDSVETGKKAVEKILETTSLGSTPVSKLPTMRAFAPPSSDTAKAAVQRTGETAKPAVEKVLETAKKAAGTPIAPDSTPRVSVSKPSFDIPSTYNFETLMKQNDDLLKKMLDDLVS